MINTSFDFTQFPADFNESILGMKPEPPAMVVERPCEDAGIGKKKKVKMHRLKAETIK